MSDHLEGRSGEATPDEDIEAQAEAWARGFMGSENWESESSGIKSLVLLAYAAGAEAAKK